MFRYVWKLVIILMLLGITRGTNFLFGVDVMQFCCLHFDIRRGVTEARLPGVASYGYLPPDISLQPLFTIQTK